MTHSTKNSWAKSISAKKFGRRIHGWLLLTLALALSLSVSPAAATQAAMSAPEASTVAASTSGAEVSDETAIERLDAQVALALTYMRTAPDKSTYFDVAAAAADGADAATLDIGSKINQLASSQRASDEDSMTLMAGVPIWGNWCGPLHGGGPAVDVLDSLCQKHDGCYGARGYFACSCDRELVSDIRYNIQRMSAGEATMAAAVSTYFTYCLCNPFA